MVRELKWLMLVCSHSSYTVLCLKLGLLGHWLVLLNHPAKQNVQLLNLTNEMILMIENYGC